MADAGVLLRATGRCHPWAGPQFGAARGRGHRWAPPDRRARSPTADGRRTHGRPHTAGGSAAQRHVTHGSAARRDLTHGSAAPGREVTARRQPPEGSPPGARAYPRPPPLLPVRRSEGVRAGARSGVHSGETPHRPPQAKRHVSEYLCPDTHPEYPHRRRTSLRLTAPGADFTRAPGNSRHDSHFPVLRRRTNHRPYLFEHGVTIRTNGYEGEQQG